MRNKKYTTLLRTFLVSGCAFIINCMITLILTPYISREVGTDAYGFVNLSKNVVQYAAIVTLALNSFASRYIVVEYHKGNMETANIYYSSTFIGDLILGTVLFAILGTFTLFLDHFLQIPAHLVSDVKILFFFSLLVFWLSTVFTVFEAAAYAENKLYIVGRFKTIAYITEATVLFIGYRFFQPRIIYVGLASFAFVLVVMSANFVISRKYTPTLRISRSHFRIDAVMRLVKSGIWASFNSLGDVLNNGLDLLVSNLLLTALAMGQLAIAKQFHVIYLSVSAIMAQAFHPIFLKSYALDDKAVLLGDLSFSMKISGMLSNVIFAGFVALGLPFYKLWIPEQDVELIYALTVINNITMIPGGPMQPLYYIYTLTLKNKLPSIVTITGGLLNVAGMYVLIKYTGLGIYAVVLTTAVVMIIINFITNPLYMAHALHMKKSTFYPNILRNVMSCAALTCLFLLLSKLYVPHTWVTLMLSAAVLAVIGGVLHLCITCTREERRKIIGFAKTFLMGHKAL